MNQAEVIGQSKQQEVKMRPTNRYSPPDPLEQDCSVNQSHTGRFRYDQYIGFVPNRPAKLSFSYLVDAVLAYVLTHAFIFVGAAVIGLLFVLILHLAGFIRAF